MQPFYFTAPVILFRPLPTCPGTKSVGGSVPWTMRPLVGCAVFATGFFMRFEANLSEYGSYSLHIRMFRYIRKHYLFASFASYSLQYIRTNSHTNIRFDAK
jgi:hypothetical protein